MLAAYATQSATSSLPISWQQQNSKPVNRDQSVPVPSTAIPVTTKAISSLPLKLAGSKLSLKQPVTSNTASAEQSSDRRSGRCCSAEEIEQKKQNALRKRRASRLKM